MASERPSNLRIALFLLAALVLGSLASELTWRLFRKPADQLPMPEASQSAQESALDSSNGD